MTLIVKCKNGHRPCAGLRCLFGSFRKKGRCTWEPGAAGAAAAAAAALKERMGRRLLLGRLLLHGAMDRGVGLACTGRLVHQPRWSMCRSLYVHQASSNLLYMNEHMRATETIVENTPEAREQAVLVTRSMQHATHCVHVRYANLGGGIRFHHRAARAAACR